MKDPGPGGLDGKGVSSLGGLAWYNYMQKMSGGKPSQQGGDIDWGENGAPQRRVATALTKDTPVRKLLTGPGGDGRGQDGGNTGGGGGSKPNFGDGHTDPTPDAASTPTVGRTEDRRTSALPNSARPAVRSATWFRVEALRSRARRSQMLPVRVRQSNEVSVAGESSPELSPPCFR